MQGKSGCFSCFFLWGMQPLLQKTKTPSRESQSILSTLPKSLHMISLTPWRGQPGMISISPLMTRRGRTKNRHKKIKTRNHKKNPKARLGAAVSSNITWMSSVHSPSHMWGMCRCGKEIASKSIRSTLGGAIGCSSLRGRISLMDTTLSAS